MATVLQRWEGDFGAVEIVLDGLNRFSQVNVNLVRDVVATITVGNQTRQLPLEAGTYIRDLPNKINTSSTLNKKLETIFSPNGEWSIIIG